MCFLCEQRIPTIKKQIIKIKFIDKKGNKKEGFIFINENKLKKIQKPK